MYKDIELERKYLITQKDNWNNIKNLPIV